jgi:hypothetical protein
MFNVIRGIQMLQGGDGGAEASHMLLKDLGK